MPAPWKKAGSTHLESEKNAFQASSTSIEYLRRDTPTPTVFPDKRESTYIQDGRQTAVVETAKDLVVDVISLEDDPTQPAVTFRMWFMGIGLSTFGGTLATIYYFKPQTVFVSVIFLALISYIMGEAMALVIPRRGWIGKWFNPHPFNKKEHAAIVIMASAAVSTPLAAEVLAVQRLYYNQTLNAGLSIFLILSSQMLGYGIAGLMRQTLVYPTRMLWPGNLPMVSLLDTLHGNKKETSSRLKLFYWVFAVVFVWEAFPEYIMPVLTGVSVFCLARRDSLVFTNLFGGSNGNEGLGFLSLCLDWQYIAGSTSPLWFPLQSLVNNVVGYLLCIALFIGLYYSNTWRARDFPFLSQILFDQQSNGTSYVEWNQTAVLNADFEVDQRIVAQQGLPYFTSSYISYLITTNMAISATITHLLLWNRDDISKAWSFATPKNLKKTVDVRSWNWKFWKQQQPTSKAEDDPHYNLMKNYVDAPDWWYGAVLVLSILIGLITVYASKSTLPWWGFLIACALSWFCILFFGAQAAITGVAFIIQPVIQMLGGFLHPGKPVANMFFVLFGYNSVSQGQLLLRDLKFAQYVHLAPRVTFTCQMVGTVIGAVFSYIMMDSITRNQRDVLLSIQGTNIWSGQNLQQFNSQSIAWGGLAYELFTVGKRYQYVTVAFLFGFVAPLPTFLAHRMWPRLRLDYWNIAIILVFMGYLFIGINSSLLSFFIVGFWSQFYLRKYKPQWFVKYNYILSAALDGGTQVLVFVFTFALFGGAGKQVNFPAYWGNNFQTGNYDYCMRDPANS